jgi:hypothetical protein
MLVDDAAVALRFDGVAGTVASSGVDANAAADGSESPPEFEATTL